MEDNGKAIGESRGEKGRKKIIAVAAALVVIGIIGYGVQLAMGLGGYVNHAPWGLYIVVFYCAAGLGAGSLIVASVALAAKLFDNGTLKRLYLVALAGFVVASGCIIADLGTPTVLFQMIVSPNFAGPLFYDMLVLIAGIAVAAIGFASLQKPTGKRTVLLACSAAVGVLVLVVEAWILAITYGHDAWNLLLGFTPALLQACVLGLCAAVLLATPDGSRTADLKGAAIALAIGALTVVVASGVEAAMGIRDTLTGEQLLAFVQTPLFWLSGAAAITALVLLGRGSLRAGAACAAIEVLLLKTAAIWAGQAIALTGSGAFVGGFGIGVAEVLVIVGIAALGVLVYELVLMATARKEVGAEGDAAPAAEKKAVIA